MIEALDPDKGESRWEPLNLGWDFDVSHFGAGVQYINPDRGFEVVGVRGPIDNFANGPATTLPGH